MKKSKQRLLWKINPLPDRGPTSYLFSTVHLFPPYFTEKLAILRNYIRASELFFTEIELKQGMNLTVPETYFQLPDQKSLKDFIGTKKYEKAKAILWKSHRIPLESFQFFSPLFINQIIAEQSLNLNGTTNLDTELWKIANEENLICSGIESVEEQLSVFRQIPLEMQLKSFLSTCRNIKKYRKSNRRLLAYYEQEAIHLLYKESKKSLGKLRHVMLYDRNFKMANRMASYIPEKASFFAVGAGHLAGEKGLLKQLKSRGFSAKPVTL